MEPRESANSVGREKLVLIQHEAQDSPKLLAVHNREQASAVPHPVPSCRRTCCVRSLRFCEEPFHASLETRQAIDHCLTPAFPLRTAGSVRPSTGPSAARVRRPADAARRRRNHPRRSTCRPSSAQVIDRVGDVQKVFPELARHVFVGGVFAGQLQRDRSIFRQYMRHPTGAVGLFDMIRRWAAARCGRRRRCCPGPGIRPRRRCRPSASLRFTHQVKLSSSLWKTRSRNARSPTPRRFRRSCRRASRPGVHRRIHIAERPFVRRELPVGMHVPFAQHQHQLILWRIRNRSAQAARSGTPGPTRRTRDTPTCPASKSRRRCRGASIRDCAPACAASGGGGHAGSPFSQSSTT